MKVFISYSLRSEDEFLLTLLAFFLKEDRISCNLSDNNSIKSVDIETKVSIGECSLYLGLLLQDGKNDNSVLNEWTFAKEKCIPAILLIEDSSPKNNLAGDDILKFNRQDIHDLIYSIERKKHPGTDNKESSSFQALSMFGNALKFTLEKGFFNPASKSSGFVLTGRLQLIEQKLTGIDGAAFQNLCDLYLKMREPGIMSINRTGSQLGKQKTVRGTPDAFFRTCDGKLIYIEYTTQAGNLVKKIKEDIDKCFDEEKTGVPVSELHKLIFCFNSRINVAEETEIVKYAQEKGLRNIELIGLDWLALEIYSKYLILAKDILGIPLDTGQLLPLDKFIFEYSNKAGQLSTPLDNAFLHRKMELSEIGNALKGNDIVIISGYPGVGKTKIALEAIDNFLIANKDYTACAVSKKDQDISADLKINIDQDKNFILLVDDANRQLLNFKQILGVFKEQPKAKIKLVVTVRDYAFNDVVNECFEFDPQKILLKKFTDQEITELINSDSFEIKNSKYQRKIVEVADGNARLAVMAARLARQKQEMFLIGDVSDLYDSYFQTFIKDFDIFANKILLKTLGIVSFFFTIDRNNKDLVALILKNFDIDYHQFNEAINELEKRELLEVQYNHARVSEQVMSTYFFYKVFIKDQVLSFKTLLRTFFDEFKPRFSDTIIPANNSFGYFNVFDKINPDLNEYLLSIRDDYDKTVSFFSIYWFYKREEYLKFYFDNVSALPEPANPIYIAHSEKQLFSWNSDQILNSLKNLLDYPTESFRPALELSFEYCRKKPESLPELVKIIRERILFEEEDIRSDFKRQTELFQLLISKLGEEHYRKVFFEIAGTFLQHQFQITRGGRKLSISFYQFPLPFSEPIKAFRKSLWNTLFDSFKVYPGEVFDVIQKFNTGHLDSIKAILDFDLGFLFPFINENLDPSIFKHVHYVRDLISRLKRQGVKEEDLYDLQNKFTSKEYEYFKKLDWNRLRGKQDFEFENYKEYEELKEEDIRKHFVFSSQKDFEVLHMAVINILSVDNNAGWYLSRSLDVILEENLKQNPELGAQLLESLFLNYQPGFSPLIKALRVTFTFDNEFIKRIWYLIKEWKHPHQLYWALSFIDILPTDKVSVFYMNEAIDVVKNMDQSCALHLDSFKKFEHLDEAIFTKLLEVIVERIESKGTKISIWDSFFMEYAVTLNGKSELLEKAYLQQAKIHDHFDHNREGLQKLVELDHQFLIKYVSEFYNEKKQSGHSNTHNRLSFVWDIANIEDVVEKAMDLIIDNAIFFGILEHPLIIFFNTLEDKQKENAQKFILKYITKYHKSERKMNAIFDVIRHAMKYFFETTLLKYLELNPDVKDFKKIMWRGNGGTYSGDVIIGEVHAKDWQKIMESVNKSPKQLELIPIKDYIKNQIQYELKSAEDDKRRRFADPRGYW